MIRLIKLSEENCEMSLVEKSLFMIGYHGG